MQLTILSDKLPNLSSEEFVHEFRDVHAAETRSMAQSLGIISRYVQGLSLSSVNQEALRNLPIPGPHAHVESFAQLTWPTLEVMQGALQTQGYKDSAGKHEFAQPRQIFLTNQIEHEAQRMDEDCVVRIVSILIPLEAAEHDFRRAWDDHATFCRKICPRYQRNQPIKLSQERLNKIFADTQFPADLVLRDGGFEEFLFDSNKDAQAFCEEHGQKLRDSYSGFASKNSYCVGFDVVVQYSDSDRGYQQIITGGVVGTIIRTKIFFGL